MISNLTVTRKQHIPGLAFSSVLWKLTWRPSNFFLSYFVFTLGGKHSSPTMSWHWQFFDSLSRCLTVLCYSGGLHSLLQ